MKPVTEIMIRISVLIFIILIYICRDQYLTSKDWEVIYNTVFLCMLSSALGIFVMNLLEAIKKWWKE